jgi:dipeptidyl aminopeptidase/acylaminoacyl peptidase
MRRFLSFAVLPLLAVSAIARPMVLEDLFRAHRITAPAVSPDGQTVVYVVSDPLKRENKTTSSLWLVPVAGGEPRQITPTGKHDRAPHWSPDGRWIAFESDRSGSTQIWLWPMDGGEPHQLTRISTEARQPVWAPDGKSIAFVSAVFPQFSGRPPAEADRLNGELIATREKSPVKARLFTELLYRHWDAWVEDRRQHLFIQPLDGGSAAGRPRDVTPGPGDAVPTSTTFSAGDDFAFSPDGRELAYTMPPVPTRTDAWSTNHDLWAVTLGSGQRRALTSNPAADGFPRYSPDGRYLAYRAQSRPGFEADRWQLMLLDRQSGQRRSLTAAFDSSVGAFAWTADSQNLVFEAQWQASEAVFRVGLTGEPPVNLVSGFERPGTNSDASVLPDGGIVFLHSTLSAAPEIFRAGGARPPVQITHQNDALFAQIDPIQLESVTVSGAGGTPVQMWIVRPPNFDPAKKYPLVFWVHGGPQSAFDDGWSTRWNAALWAAQGYVVTLANPRGSVGFGQKFTDEISRDWGGKVYQDLLACLALIKAKPYVDSRRMAAAGASFGGYMMAWFEGHTDQFRTIVMHDGVYSFSGMYGSTDELWFEEWEHGQPWATRDYNRFSPDQFAANFQTPMLIIHNQLDFRVPIGQGEALFSVLQRKGIASEFLSFPDEGHWVLKPGNSELWHQTIFSWLAQYLTP